MLRYDFEESVGYWITVTHQAYHRALKAKLAPLGITYRQAQVLGWLALEGRLTQADLASRMFIEPPSLVGVLDRMERARWISRRSCSKDRRKKWITTLASAKPVWRQIIDCARELRHQATKGFTRREVETLRRLMERVRENMSRDASVAEVS